MRRPPWGTYEVPVRPLRDDPPDDVRQLVMTRHGFLRCECCGVTTTSRILHHRRVKGMGGSRAADRHSPCNLVAICNSCHDYIHRSGDPAVHDNGWLVKQGANPARVALILHDDRTVFLTSDGAYDIFPGGSA